MARAIRVISVERGYDPRDYTLLAFGGAGPLHAARLAARTRAWRASSSRASRASCARSACWSPICAPISRARACCRLCPASLPSSLTTFAELRGRADRMVRPRKGSRRPPGASRARSTCATRGQNYELTIALPDGATPRATVEAIDRGLHARPRPAYGFAADGEPVQFVTLRIEAIGLVPKAALPSAIRRPARCAGAIIGPPRRCSCPRPAASIDCPVYDRTRLRPGHRARRPGHRRADGLDDAGAARPDRAVDAYRN